MFVGHEHRANSRAARHCRLVLLFLENIWDYAEGDEAGYR